MSNEKKEYEQRIIGACQEYADVIVSRLNLNMKNKQHQGVAEGIQHGLEYAFRTMLHSDKLTPEELLEIVQQAIQYQELYNVK